MFVIENTIKVTKGYADQFHARLNHLAGLEKVPGFIELNLMQKRGEDDCDVIIVWSKWESQKAHNEWAQSDMFRKSHGGPRSEHLLDNKIALYDVVAYRASEAGQSAEEDAV